MTFLKLLRPHRTRFSFSRTLFSGVMGVLVVMSSFPQALLAARAADVLAGTGHGSFVQGGIVAGAGGAVAAPVVKARAADVLARTGHAIQAVQAMQAAARSAAAAMNNLGMDPNHPGHLLPNVPNGLVTGGLVPDSGLVSSGVAQPVISWQNANTPTQSTANGKTTVTIQQTGQQALLNWQTFNIGKDTTLSFDQSGGGANVGQWIAFNKINDPTGVPSQILGSMNAQGQVYLINANGIIFGGASQVNLHTLVASSLPINDNLLNRGLLNNPDLQFLFSSLSIPALSGGSMPAFVPPVSPNTPGGRDGDVVVQAGALLSSPTSADHVGGRIALVGPNVTNAGTISTPDGQTILAAGNQVAVTAHSSDDPSLRGLDVYVGAVDSFSGAATNTGLVEAARGSVTLVGKNINQLGGIDSTTSVSLNGRIDLLANYGTTVVTSVAGQPALDPTADGVVVLGQNSVTRILPEWSSSETVAGSQLALPSQINIQGVAIHLDQDASLFAPNANVTLSAGLWNLLMVGGAAAYSFSLTGGQIYLDQEAEISVAGSTDVQASVLENIVTAQLRGTELANSPLQRDGVLRGSSIQFDLRQFGTYNGQTWVGTPVADVSGYAALVQRTVGELTTSGGSVQLNAGGSVVMQNTSSVDVSGGWIDYLGGTVQTTRLISNGHSYDISQASPDLIYTGIAQSISHYETGYVQGGSGGLLSIKAPAMALDGSLYGNTVAGPRQRQNIPGTLSVASGTVLPNSNALPIASSLSIAFQSQVIQSGVLVSQSPTPPDLTIGGGVSQTPADAFTLDSSGKPSPLRADRVAQVVLSSDLVGANGFGSLTIDNSVGNITLAANTPLTGQAGGSITLLGTNIDIEGNLVLPGGNFSATAFQVSPYLTTLRSTPVADPTHGNFTLGSEASLSLQGLIMDDRGSSQTAGDLPLIAGGGAVTIKGYNVNLTQGSSIDVSGGVAVSAAGKYSYGNAGAITIKSGQDINVASVVGGSLSFNAVLKGYSGNKGGALSIVAPLIQVGNSTAPLDPANTLLLAPEFFNEGGFSSFTLTALGEALAPDHYLPGLVIAPGTVISPVVENFQAAPDQNNQIQLTPITLDKGLRTAARLSFAATGLTDPFSGLLSIRGDLVMGKGASIETDPGGSVSFKGQTVALLGSVTAPGGNITVTGGNSYVTFSTPDPDVARVTVDLGPSSLLSVAGVTQLVPDSTGNGYRTGSVLAGGNITVSGNIVAETGAVLDVSGATGVLDLPAGYSQLNPSNRGLNTGYIPTQVDSNGGSIVLTGGQELFTDATLLGAAGGPSAIGGSLTLSSKYFVPSGVSIPATPLVTTMIVTQNGPVIPVPFYGVDQTAIGNPVLDSHGNVLPGLGYFSADHFENSGLDSLTIKGSVQFSGPVNLSARSSLLIGDGGVVSGNDSIVLTAPYVALGTALSLPPEPNTPFILDGTPFYFSPSTGSGSLTVNASQLIDVGNLSLQTIGVATLSAGTGEIRGAGTLDIQGTVLLSAGQIYPTTDSIFTIAAYDHGSTLGSVTIAGDGLRSLPLSAGGILNLYGSEITQGGVLKAPIGTINLGWNGVGTGPVDLITGNTITSTRQLTLLPGSITSVSAVDPITGKGLVIPYGINPNGTSWIDPNGIDISVGGVPGKSINLSAQTLSEQTGATLDLSGGGDLFAYRWVSGVGGTQDVLASTTSFAVIPGYQLPTAPIAPFNTASGVFGSDQGYVNGSLKVGDQIYLAAGNGFDAGIYTLLPARYALLSGAFLVTPKPTLAPNGTITQTDGASVVSGYRFNGLDSARTGQPILSAFEVASQSVVSSRAAYDSFYASSFLSNSAQSAGVTIPRLPGDAGSLVLQATQAMTIQGLLKSQAATGGLGGLVDISTPVDILVAGPNTAISGFNGLVLQSSALSALGADSLLLGGIRSSGIDGETISVTTNHITVDNEGAALSGPDIILAANQTLTLAAGSDIEQSGVANGINATLQIGDATIAGSGDGLLLRVSSNPSTQLIRSGVDLSATPSMTIGAGTILSGVSVTLDSTQAAHLDPTAHLSARSLNLGSGQISLQLSNPGQLQPSTGLVLSNNALQTLQASANSLSFLSYSSIDFYGTGQIGTPTFLSLGLHAGEIRGFNNGGGAVSLDAATILIDNSPGNSGAGFVTASGGTFSLNAGTIQLGGNSLGIDQFAQVELNATGGILANNTGGLSVQGALLLTSPLITGATGASQTISASGALTLQAPVNATSTLTGGLGASLTLVGNRIADNSNIVLPSGNLTLHATGGDLQIGNLVNSRLDVAGVAQNFYDLVKYTSGGQINLVADTGNVNLASHGVLSVAAPAGGGDAGSLSLSLPQGSLILAGSIFGTAGAGGNGGIFSLDVGSQASLGTLDTTLNAVGFSGSRSYRIRNGDVQVDGLAKTSVYNLSADHGSITVAGTIDASGVTGGTIDLVANGNVTLLNGSFLTVAAQQFSDAGKGGAITLEAGDETNGVVNSSALLDLQTGSTLDLSVAANTASSAALGDFTGTLHLRAPQTAGNTDLQVNPINGTILNASKIVVEGYQVFNASGDGSIDNQKQNVYNNAQLFTGNTGDLSTPGSITYRLLSQNAGLALVVVPGAEIINTHGDLTLTNNWDLSTYRFGAASVPGVLTLRATGNLIFQGSLSDGFTSAAYNAQLLDQNSLLPVNEQSWSYRLVSGADFSGADFRALQSLATLGADAGSLKLGKIVTSNNGNAVVTGGANAKTSTLMSTLFQTIRTGSGDIEVAAGRSVQLLNQFATIYTAGTQVLDPGLNGTFNLPNTTLSGAQGTLGVVQESPAYTPQYSLAGGNVVIHAQSNIEHLTRNNLGTLVPDSERELPTNWLYRRGYVDPTTGQFGTAKAGDIASTTWWIDFSNFFEGVGALGGGNVSLIAGNNISNVDAVVPTNARMPGGTPDASALVELGGGDLLVRSGNNIDGGVYYVERGNGTLHAGNQILTNSTRSPSLTTITVPATIYPSQAWLPTTLFLGKGNFDVSALGDLLLGPVANPFLLPQGYSNTYWDKSYFSTYATTDTVSVSSLTGGVTLRETANLLNQNLSTPILANWYQQIDLLSSNPPSLSYYQPWLRTVESNIQPFSTVVSLMPSTLRVTAFSGEVNLDGGITLSPSPTGTIDLAASGAINGLQPTGVSTSGGPVSIWSSSSINLSDANPDAIPGISNPYAYQLVAGITATKARLTNNNFLSFIDSLFNESGSTQGAQGSLQIKQALHDSGLLHAGDLNPVHLYSLTGDISGLTLFSGKFTRVIAGRDITDIAFYLQNIAANDVSLVASGRDMIPYDPNALLLAAAQSPGNALGQGVGALAGDIQISGPGTLEILAGRNLTLGSGRNNDTGVAGIATGVGITSIGNARNPGLPTAGADLTVAAGIGSASSLDVSNLDFNRFTAQFLNPVSGGVEAIRYLPLLGDLLGLSNASNQDIWTAFENLSKERQDSLALSVFYLVLRDAGRDHNNPTSPGYRNYTAGFDAIAALFPNSAGEGNINLTSREIKTTSGGSISLIAPGGALVLGDYPIRTASSPSGNPAADMGILTQDGGNISIFTHGGVDVGTSRIFTLRGGNEMLWASEGDIAAGASSKTVQSAPPTRVLVDLQSGDIQTDLAGLSTGGGIGVLETVVGVAPSDVDLIAPAGTIDAGDAGIRVSGNLNLAAVQVINATNIQVGGVSAGAPPSGIAAPNLGGLASASNAQGASSGAADQIAKQGRGEASSADEIPSMITVEVLGYGGGDDEENRRPHPPQQSAGIQTDQSEASLDFDSGNRSSGRLAVGREIERYTSQKKFLDWEFD